MSLGVILASSGPPLPPLPPLSLKRNSALLHRKLFSSDLTWKIQGSNRGLAA